MSHRHRLMSKNGIMARMLESVTEWSCKLGMIARTTKARMHLQMHLGEMIPCLLHCMALTRTKNERGMPETVGRSEQLDSHERRSSVCMLSNAALVPCDDTEQPQTGFVM